LYYKNGTPKEEDIGGGVGWSLNDITSIKAALDIFALRNSIDSICGIFVST